MSPIPAWLISLLRTKRSFRARRRRTRACYATQGLEDRRLLSGNVVVEISAQKMQVRGDAQDNLVEIGISNGDVVVKGLQGTTVNGQSQFVAFANTDTIARDVSVSLEEGSDSVFFSDGLQIDGDVLVRDKNGATTLGLRGVNLNGNLIVKTGQEADRISLENTSISESAAFHTAGGDDLISLLETDLGRTLKAKTGAGADDIIIDQGAIDGHVWLRTGEGADDVLIRGATIGRKLRVRTGAGDDFAMMDGITVHGRTSMRLGQGDDNLVAAGTNHFQRRVVIRGSQGNDAADISDQTTFDVPVRQTGFEADTVPPSVITDKLNNAQTGLVTRATALRTEIINLIGAPLTLTTDTSSNTQTVQSSGTLVTRLATLAVTGQTAAGANVSVDSDGDGQFNDGTTQAASNGSYTLNVPLTAGAHTLKLRASNSDGSSPVQEIKVYRAVGTVARLATALGNVDVELLDTDAPITTANFLAYQARYANSIVHRSVTTANAGVNVIQGGGFALNAGELTPITTDPAIANEFKAANSNVRGTLAMALPSGNQNGATSQWFINVTNNTNLDADHFTVFGRVIGDGMTVVDAIHDLTTFNLNPLYANDNSALVNVPLRDTLDVTRQLTGTVSVAANSAAVTGTGTAFTTELEVGSRVRIGTEERTVTAITDVTHLTLSSPLPTDATNAPLFTQQKATAAELVLFTGITKILPTP